MNLPEQIHPSHDMERVADGMSVGTDGQPTEWLDITARRDGGLCVAWNSDRYLLTDAQARKLRETAGYAVCAGQGLGR